MGILVDTCFFIDLERGKKADFSAAFKQEKLFISAISASELLMGLHLAKNATIALKRETFIDHILQHVGILEFTHDIAKLHAKWAAALFKRNISIGAHDLIIAATALYHDFPVVTRNVREFKQLEGLQVIEYSLI